MKKTKLALKCVFLLSICSPSLVSAYAGFASPPPVRIPMRVFIEGSYADPAGNRITSDGRGGYVDGVDGVTSGADTSSGWGMTTKTKKVTATSRFVYYDFSDRIYLGDGGNTAPWSVYPTKIQSRFHVLNFLNLTADSADLGGFVCPAGFSCGQDMVAPYHMYMRTHGNTGQLANGRDEYVLRFKSPGYLSVIEHPCLTSYLKLYHYPEVRSGNTIISPERWVVTPEASQCTYNGITYDGPIGALTLGTNSGNYGQYLMPFKLTIERK